MSIVCYKCSTVLLLWSCQPFLTKDHLVRPLNITGNVFEAKNQRSLNWNNNHIKAALLIASMFDCFFIPKVLVVMVREGFTKKSSCYFGFCPNEGGGGPYPNFWHLFISAFLVNISSKMPRIWILGCIHDPQSKYSAFILEEFWIMSHFECRLSRRFWRSKKVVQVVQIGGRGKGEVIWKKSKRTATFFRENNPYTWQFSYLMP